MRADGAQELFIGDSHLDSDDDADDMHKNQHFKQPTDQVARDGECSGGAGRAHFYVGSAGNVDTAFRDELNIEYTGTETILDLGGYRVAAAG